MNTRMLVRDAMYLSIALILSHLESLLPPFFPIPGMKIGLANIVLLYVLVRHEKKEAFTLFALRLLIISVLSGTLFGPRFLIAASGSAMAFAGMSLALHSPLSVVGISILGAACHNVGQLAAAWRILDSPHVWRLLPALLLSAIAFGLFTGSLVRFLLKREDLH